MLLSSQNLQSLWTFELILTWKVLLYQLIQVILDYCLMWPVTEGNHHSLSWLTPCLIYWTSYPLTWGVGKACSYILEQLFVSSSIMSASNTKDNLNFITTCGKCSSWFLFMKSCFPRMVWNTRTFMLYKDMAISFQSLWHCPLVMILSHVRLSCFFLVLQENRTALLPKSRSSSSWPLPFKPHNGPHKNWTTN